jgi:hypothetical protein
MYIHHIGNYGKHKIIRHRQAPARPVPSKVSTYTVYLLEHTII